MARPLRADLPDTYYHVLSRGNERRALFRDDADRRHFVDLLGRMAERFGLEVWAYVLMGNHYHLVVRTRAANLSRAMHWLGVAYSVWHNRRHGRAGHLFQGRFKSFIVAEEPYLEQLLLYTHRNPLRAGMVQRLADYPWSSYRGLAYGRGCPGWFDRARVLALFGGSAPRFRRAVQAYSEEASKLLEDLRHGFFLGSLEACERLLERARLRPNREQPQARVLARPASVDALVAAEADRLGISRAELEGLRRPIRGRERPVRDALIYLAWQRGCFSEAAIGAHFRVGYTTISNARKRGEEHLRTRKDGVAK